MTRRRPNRIMSVGSATMVTVLVMAAAAGAQSRQDLAMDGSPAWKFVGGAWTQDAEGVINPATERADDHLAFHTARAYGDVEAEFDFRINTNAAGAGFIVRAQDPSRYYMVYFPQCGQQVRARHFWVAIAKADGSGWLRMLRWQMVQGVASDTVHEGVGVWWHHAKVSVKGDRISVSVNGRPPVVAHDDEYKAGYVGLESWGYTSKPGSSFRNVTIEGQPTDAPAFNTDAVPPTNYFIPYKGARSAHGGITRAPDGNLLMGTDAGLLRSENNGRTWQLVEAGNWPDGGYLLTTRDEHLLTFTFKDNRLSLTGSADGGTTWSPAESVAYFPPPYDHTYSGPDEKNASIHASLNPLMELADGTLLMQLYGGHPLKLAEGHAHINHWGSVHCMAFSTRSTDGGRTWSRLNHLSGHPSLGRNLDHTEAYQTQLRTGQILILTRPIYSPWMWETRSDNGAKSWGACVRGPLPGYACTMLPHETASGAVVIGGRLPGLGLHCSFDGGMAWRTWQVDRSFWAMGTMYEVEPDVILWVYMDNWGGNARAQFIRVTPNGLEPARDMLP